MIGICNWSSVDRFSARSTKHAYHGWQSVGISCLNGLEVLSNIWWGLFGASRSLSTLIMPLASFSGILTILSKVSFLYPLQPLQQDAH